MPSNSDDLHRSTPPQPQTDRPAWMKKTESGVILGLNHRSYPQDNQSLAGHCEETGRHALAEALRDDFANEPIGRSSVLVVLVQGSINDYAAYIGLSDDPKWVRRHGNKISFEEACVHFPRGQLVEERYRR